MSAILFPYAKPILIGFACLTSGAIGWSLRDADYQAHLKKDAQAEAHAQVEARKVEAKQEAQAQSVREIVTQKQAEAQVVYRTITQEVPVYVTRTQFEDRVVAGGGLPAGLVWLYNQAASGTAAPLPSGLNPDSPTGVDVSTLASTTAGNFSLYHACKAEVEGWHTWYDNLAASWPSEPKE